MTNRTLHELLDRVSVLHFDGDSDFDISGVSLDSRTVVSGGIYVVIKGWQTDGNKYIEDAIRNGAKVIVSEEKAPSDVLPLIAGWIQVDSARRAAADIASWYYGDPGDKIKVVGVTGTNGKSSIVLLLHQLFQNMGFKTGVFSTVSNIIHQTVLPSKLTTPDPITLYRDMAAMVDAGCDYVFMEVSSHALDQDRVYGIDFDVAVFTNITHDHIDYHGSFKAYLNAKKKFFDQLSSRAMALVNGDDRNAGVMVQNSKAKVRTYGLRSLADYHAKVLDMSFDSMKLQIDGKELITHITGKFNAYNLLAVYAVGDYFEIEREELLLSLSALREVKGRFQRLNVGAEGPRGIVDYAHTPDAVEQLVTSASELVSGQGRLITVLGCGGDRDKAKRPKMARAAASHSDIVILTSDNPRMEDPEKIIEDMFVDLMPHHQAKTFRVTDRREAIRMAVSMAQSGDLIVVAGKGHEDYQEIKKERIKFDDVIELENALKQKMIK